MSKYLSFKLKENKFYISDRAVKEPNEDWFDIGVMSIKDISNFINTLKTLKNYPIIKLNKHEIIEYYNEFLKIIIR